MTPDELAKIQKQNQRFVDEGYGWALTQQKLIDEVKALRQIIEGLRELGPDVTTNEELRARGLTEWYL